MRLRFRFALTAIAALAAPSVAYADPITVVVALQPCIGGTCAAFIASNLATIGLTLLPVLLRLTGRAAWYLPGWLDRLLPRIHFGHGERPAPVRPAGGDARPVAERV